MYTIYSGSASLLFKNSYKHSCKYETLLMETALAMIIPSALIYEDGFGESLIILVIFGLFGLMSSRIFWSRSFWSRILIVGGALDSYLRTWASDPSRNEIEPNGQEASFMRTKEGPVGIGGWLIIPTIGIVLAPFYHMGSIIARLQSPELYEDAVKLHIIGDAALLVLAVLVGFSLFAGKRRTPTLIITYYLCTTAFFALMACIYESMGIELKNQVPFMLVALAGQVITCVIWIPYFAKSRRVKVTFNDRSISLRQADKLIVHGREVPLINLKNDGRE
jgi:hypothetical protein